MLKEDILFELKKNVQEEKFLKIVFQIDKMESLIKLL